MGQVPSLSRVDTEVDAASGQSNLNHTSTRDSIVTKISIAGDSLVLILLFCILIFCGVLWYLHKVNIGTLHTRLSNLAHLTGFGNQHLSEPNQTKPLRVVKTETV